jgi:hypothetical protein
MTDQYINIGQDSSVTIGAGTCCKEFCADCQSLIPPPIFPKLIPSLAEGVKEIVGIAEYSVMPDVACANL